MNLTITTVRIPLSGTVGFSDAMIVKPAAVRTHPCVLIRTPYPRTIALVENNCLMLATSGYVVVIQSSRGRHGSDGAFTAFLHEEMDGEVAVNWCHEQAWCDGHIFLMGKSYEGFSDWAVSKLSLSPIVGLMVSMTASQPIDWFYEAGAFRQSFAQSWGLSLAYTDETNNTQLFEIIHEYAQDLASLYEIHPEKSPLLSFLNGYHNWLTPKRLTEFGVNYAQKRTVPIHMVTGWNDIFVGGSLRDASAVKVQGDRIIIGPWSHDTEGKRVIGNFDYGVRATTGEFSINDDRLAWMKAVLNKGTYKNTSYFVLDSNDWKTCYHWPPRTHFTELPLISLSDPESLSERIQLCRDSRIFSPGGRIHDPLLPLAGGFQCSKIINDPLTKVFETYPLVQSQDVAGVVKAQLVVSCEESFLITAWLSLRTLENKYIPLSTGAFWVSKSPEPKKIDFRFSEIAVRIPVASKLIFVLGCSSWPEFFSSHSETMPAFLQEIKSMCLKIPIIK
jgi:predicted acyl esterase